MMAYSTEQIAMSLRAAREARGLSQRALSKLVDVPQSHISKIESGGVDLRLSSLVEMARALDLEVTLVPRKNISAVNSITRQRSSKVGHMETTARLSKELRRLLKTTKLITERHPELQQVAQLRQRVSDLSLLEIPNSAIDNIKQINTALEEYAKEPENNIALNHALLQLKNFRNMIVHIRADQPMAEKIRPAYSLEEDNHG
jgi:transcriptional regulator with XRE-family HTH domain